MTHRRTLWVWLVLVACLLTLAEPSRLALAQDERCFSETSYCISGRIRQFWEQNGGLPVFGYPISMLRAETIEGRSIQVQWFERNRLELHPENARPFDVLLGRLGADDLKLTEQQNPGKQYSTRQDPQSGCRYFPETGQNVCGAILKFWRSHGIEIDGRRGFSEAENLALLGLPLSGVISFNYVDYGGTYDTQFFERARVELHPENRPPNDVQLGLLGSELLGASQPAPAPAPPTMVPAPNPLPGQTPLPPSQNASVQPERGPRGTVFEAQAYGFRSGERVGVYVTAPGGGVYGAPFQVDTNDRGVAEGVTFRTTNSASFPTGIWAITFEGVDSGRKGIAYFEVTP